MKQRFMKLIMMIVLLSLFSTVSCSAGNVASVSSFSDVPTEHWGYQTIMNMTQSGLFKGTTEPINGIGTFSPDNVMTRAEFVTVSLRAIFPEQAKNIGNDSGKWWKGYYELALTNSILLPAEFENGDLDKPISRQEMAMIMVRCVEKNGESLSKRVATTQIADYTTINEYYKNYVRDCFSFGLINGVDLLGTFAPSQSLTRAQAATVLNRLVDKSVRIKVEFPQENAPSSGGSVSPGSTKPSGGSGKPSGGGINKPTGGIVTPPSSENNEKPAAKYPWEEKNAKKPSEYTFDEYMELSDDHKEAFFITFDSAEAYDNWMDDAKNKVSVPWKNGGKQPAEYTTEEYNALTTAQKIIFMESFGSIEAFENWVVQAQDKENAKELPWEKEGRQPSDYTWEEYEALSAEHQMAFQNSFENIAAFDKWKERVNPEQPVTKLPWEEEGATQPYDYTWEEFEKLTDAQQIAFQNTFESIEAFEEWRKSAQGDENKTEAIPWENGGKQPCEYSWEEYNALSEYLQMKFQTSFENAEAFDEWLRKVQGGAEEESNIPWENGGKQPSEYTWEEFEALSAELQMKFQNSFGGIEAFDEWLRKAQGGTESKVPWEADDAKKPSEYTWAEFEALSSELQMKFQNSFASIEEFDEWLQKAQDIEADKPWENGGKQPAEYTWEEFEALTPALQMAFQNSFASIDDFDAWLVANKPE